MTNQNIRTNSSQTNKLRYFLLEKECAPIENDDINKHLYGIKVEKLYNNTVFDVEDTGWISNCKDQVMNFINILVENSVTPISLVYVVDDLMSM